MKRIALIGENSCEYISHLLEIWNSGNCAVLIDWRIPFETILNMMYEADVDQCCIDKVVFEKFDINESVNIDFIVYEKTHNIFCMLPDAIRIQFKPNYSCDEAIVLYSSGTTGKAKGIVLTHRAININADAILDYMQIDHTDCLYIARPLSHSSTVVGELLTSLKSGTRLLIGPTIVPPRVVLNNIKKFGITVLCINPTLGLLYAKECQKNKYDLTLLETIYISGSILIDEVYNYLHKVFEGKAIYNMYGLSEAGPRVTAQRGDSCKSNSVGKTIAGVQIVLVDENGIEVPKGKYGILHVNSPSLFNGYIVGEPKRSLYNGWLNTGDIGYFDIDDELHIVGRGDDVIVCGTRKIYPDDVNSQICKAANVFECVVTNVTINLEDILCCLYVSDSEIDYELRNKLSKVLMKHEIPRIFVRSDNIPKSENGKVLMENVKTMIVEKIGK